MKVNAGISFNRLRLLLSVEESIDAVIRIRLAFYKEDEMYERETVR